jgi:hypothetical protein
MRYVTVTDVPIHVSTVCCLLSFVLYCFTCHFTPFGSDVHVRSDTPPFYVHRLTVSFSYVWFRLTVTRSLTLTYVDIVVWSTVCGFCVTVLHAVCRFRLRSRLRSFIFCDVWTALVLHVPRLRFTWHVSVHAPRVYVIAVYVVVVRVCVLVTTFTLRCCVAAHVYLCLRLIVRCRSRCTARTFVHGYVWVTRSHCCVADFGLLHVIG